MQYTSMHEDSGDARPGSQQLPPLRPIRRLRVLMSYRFGWLVAAAVALTLILTFVVGGSLFNWALGASTLLLLATGGIPELAIGSDDALPGKPDRWLPDYNGLHHIGLVLAALAMLHASQVSDPSIPWLTPALSLLPQAAAATAGWIILRRTLILIPMLIAKLPFVGRICRYLRPEYLYLAVVCGLGIFAFYAARILTVLQLFSYILIFIVPAVGYRSFARPATSKIIATHLPILLIITTVMTDDAASGIIYSIWPFNIAQDSSDDFTLKLGLSFVLVALLFNLRRSLVVQEPGREAPAALSIYPDPATYVDDDGYEADVAKLIHQSNGGVVGVTGVRGAGKSALLAKIRARFKDRYCVVWTVAPVTHRSEDDLSFLMSVCRTLCQKAIDDAQQVLYGRRNTIQQAGEEFLRRIRIPLLLLAIFSGMVLLARDTGLEVPALLGDKLPAPDVYRLGDLSIRFNTEQTRESFQEAVSAERLAIRRLVARIDAVLPSDEETASSSSTVFAVVPLVRHRGFDLIVGEGSTVDPTILLENHKWLPEDVRTKLEENDAYTELDWVDDFISQSSEDAIAEGRKVGDYFKNIEQSKELSNGLDAAYFLQLQKLFSHANYR
jgi:hypothetical protein